MSLVLEDVAKDLKSEKPVISEPVLDSMTERYLAIFGSSIMDAERFKLFMGG